MQKDEFMDLLMMAGLNKKEFANIADIPYSTVNNWGLNRKGRVLEIPNWVRQFIYYYIKSKKFDLIKEQVCKDIMD